MTRRCSTCGISYPWLGHQKCDVCGEKTDGVRDEVDKDWQEKVRLAKSAPDEPEGLSEADRIFEWRRSELERAGFSYPTAVELALRKDIELRPAVELAKKAGPRMALEILN